eukprot:92934_1
MGTNLLKLRTAYLLGNRNVKELFENKNGLQTIDMMDLIIGAFKIWVSYSTINRQQTIAIFGAPAKRHELLPKGNRGGWNNRDTYYNNRISDLIDRIQISDDSLVDFFKTINNKIKSILNGDKKLNWSFIEQQL